MSPRNLLTHPRWQAADLGFPMPDSPHAVSACLPLWEHNIRYEEGDPGIVGRLQAAYPRFCLHPYVRELCRRMFGGDNAGLIFPSARAASRAVDYCHWRDARSASTVQFTDPQMHGVRVDPAEFPALKEYWQHSGDVLTSRAAEQLLAGQGVPISATDTRSAVLRRLADLHQTDPEVVRIHLCGMAAISTVWRAIAAIRGKIHPCVQFGFPYVDTLKIQLRFPPGPGDNHHIFYPKGDQAELDHFESLLERRQVSAVYCECPTNPLLQSPDVHRLKALADKHDFLLVVDDTLSACLNHRWLPLADVVVTSLTKYFSGYGDVLAGASVVNPHGRHATVLQEAIARDFEELLCDADIEVLERNSRDLRSRVDCINRTATEIARRLQAHPQVASVYHPSLAEPEPVQSREHCSHEQPSTGHGGLLSIVLKNPETSTPVFFDHLRLCKGPNLGTNFTLCCPYTILAHYTELEFVESCGVSRWLLRFSIGTEPAEEIWKRFEEAFASLVPER